MVSTNSKRRVYLPFAMRSVYRQIFDLRKVCLLSKNYPGTEITMGYCYFDTYRTDVYEVNIGGQSFWMPMYHLDEELEYEGEQWMKFVHSENGMKVS